MNGILAILLVLCCVLGSAVICLAIVVHDSKDNSRAAQRQHDAEYAPAGNVYVVLQTTYNYDNRQVHIDANAMPLVTERQQAITPTRKFKVVGGY